ncbi:MAG: NAD-dependent epimerase/dehydratase family protein [Patescibacteria group bacterium]|nr:NAD-dependent epimerase/dehydratase family protein [Patescibacteria group bacterium]
MKILVTGGAGFIGSNLLEFLVKRGYEVVGLDCYTPYYSVNQKRVNARDLNSLGVSIRELDLAKDNLSDVVMDIDVIFHLAAQPGISSDISLDDYIRNNIIATHRLLESVKNSKSLQMFVNISTSSVYGLNATVEEDKAPLPASYYGVTKLAAEQLVLSYQRQGFIQACSARLFSIYGPRERPDKLFPRLIKSILRKEEFPLYEGSEKHLRSFTYVLDVVSALELFLKNTDKVNGEIFNVGSDKCISTKKAIEIVEDVMGKKAKAKIFPQRLGDQYKTHANIGKICRVIGWNPEFSPEKGLKDTVLWYEKNLKDLP